MDLPPETAAATTAGDLLRVCLFETRSNFCIRPQQSLRAKNARALSQKELPQLGSKKRGTVWSRIKIEEQSAVLVQKSRPNVVDKKFPIRWGPFHAVAYPTDPVKTNAVSSHKIEFVAEIGQESLSFDPADNARNIEERSSGSEERLVIGVEAENLMAEKFADVEEITGAAAKIDYAQRRGTVEPKILRALDVDLDPINDVFKTINPCRARPIGIFVTQFFELGAIERVENAASVDRVGATTEMFERAGEQVGRKYFLELA